ncbi:MAG: PEP-CTERM sorting domain-containing protein [Burkholderiales bacterium]|nr:PEP-CTERM sorting domain-containing protein [Burkholderiales bacterium]MBW8891779.1 PEP-CTERM sorting domain-containing protein [Burkholderiales bacterium]
MTLKHTSPNGTVDPEYTNLMGMNNGDLADAVGTLGNNFGRLNTQAGNCSGTCATDYAANSSYLNVKGQLAYAGSIFKADQTLPSAAAGSPSIFNAVNHSSWFYATTATSDNSTDAIAVDEFDNGTLAGGHDAYWGLGIDSNGNYILSFTMEPSLAEAQTAAGALLRLRTDFTANYGHARLITVPGGDALNGVGAVTAVPEPATWGLMGLGLAMLAARARRRTR